MTEEELEYEHLDIDPATIFEEGAASGVAQFQKQLEEQLSAEGMTQEEIEAFFDPRRRPRRRGHKRGKINCSAKQRATMPQICKGGGSRKTGKKHTHYAQIPSHYRRTYDAAPLVGGYRATAKRYGKKAKGMVAGLKGLVLPGAVIATVYNKYVERAAALKAAGAMLDGKLVDGVFAALQYDLKNRPTSSMMSRMKLNASKILSPAVLGVGVKYAAKKVKLHPKVNQVASMGGDALIGNAIGIIISTILDPPNPEPVMNNQGTIRLVDSQTQPPAAAPVMSSVSTPGGYY